MTTIAKRMIKLPYSVKHRTYHNFFTSADFKAKSARSTMPAVRRVSRASDVPNAWPGFDLFKNQTGVRPQNAVSWHFVGNIQGDSRKFLGILDAILGHKYLNENNSNGVISSEWLSQHLQQKWLWLQSDYGWIDLSTGSIVLPTWALRKRARVFRN